MSWELQRPVPHYEYVIMGDNTVGKTSLIQSLHHPIPPPMQTDVLDLYSVFHVSGGVMRRFRLWELSGDALDTKSPLLQHIMHVDVVILVYDLTRKASFDSVKSKWYPFAKRWCPYSAMMVVGNKYDKADTDRQVQAINDAAAWADPLCLNRLEVSTTWGYNTTEALLTPLRWVTGEEEHSPRENDFLEEATSVGLIFDIEGHHDALHKGNAPLYYDSCSKKETNKRGKWFRCC